MSMTLTNEGSHLKLTTGSGSTTTEQHIPTLGLISIADGDYVIIRWIAAYKGVDNQAKFLYTDVTSPSSTSAKDLASTIQGYANQGIDPSTGAILVINQAPGWNHFTNPEKIIDYTATGALTTRKVIPFQSYKNSSIHWKLATTDAGDTTTMTFWATDNPDADDSSDTDWVDKTEILFGDVSEVANNSTNEDMRFFDSNIVALKFMVKVVSTTGGANTNSAKVYIVKA